jgi:hypothetical protein
MRMSAAAFCVALAHIMVTPARPAVAADGTAASCRRLRNDDTLHRLPSSEVMAARSALNLGAVPPALIERGTVWRCDRGRALACFVGANLPCGKLDARVERDDISTWCEHHSNEKVPAYVAGHDTLWGWRCEGAVAVTTGRAWTVDVRGFAAENWRPLSGPGCRSSGAHPAPG